MATTLLVTVTYLEREKEKEKRNDDNYSVVRGGESGKITGAL
jgi:hypothetical protein